MIPELQSTAGTHTVLEEGTGNPEAIGSGTPSRTPTLNSQVDGVNTDVERNPNIEEKTPVLVYSPQDLERLGRERPAIFHDAWSEIGFCFSTVMAQVLSEYFVSGFNVILPTLIQRLDIPQASSVWPASAFSLVVAATLLVFGRLGDIVGGYPLYVFGMSWLCVWSIIAGFSQNKMMLIFCRMLQGFGPAAYLPSGVKLMANVYRPGPRKNVVFSIYATCACLGFFVGIFFSGVSAQWLDWNWYFWFGAIFAAVTAVSSAIFIPSDVQQTRRHGVKMDYIGACLIVAGLTLFIFAITDSSHAPQGWRTSYILVTIIVGGILLGVAVYFEGWVAKYPLLPFDLFSVPHMKALTGALLFFYGCMGVFMLYATLYMENIMGADPIEVVCWFLPMAVGGFVLPIVLGFFLHMLPGTVLLAISGTAWIMCGLLFAIMKRGASYWAYVFPSMICGTTGIDITFNITNIFITTTQPRERQGLAGALINSLMHLGIALLLGFADIAQTQQAGRGMRTSYKTVFWYQVACSAVSLVLMVLFVRMDAAKSELTADERRALDTQQTQLEKKGDMENQLYS